ncbi:hypothetical protein CALCODRAFT_502383 [Calocera cornea HHB12733]|uniref:DNA polymerase delta subunit 4 n=1 Tax=Calocera cornea HHB12733 TaxID=1353952 RepID=A0A165DA45_9BASI|nr:hypothetical protein CALCODRAFT_502383 [Calocera cornea HHB12733]
MPAARRDSAGRAGSAPYVQQKLSFSHSKPGASAPLGKTTKKSTSVPGSRKQTDTPPPPPVQEELLDESSDEEEEQEARTPTLPPKSVENVKRAKLDVQDKAGKFGPYWTEAQERMGHQDPVHGKDESKVYRMLRVFDLSYEYGPCIGMSRLERWERAEAMGLEPPPEVREILMTEEGTKDARLAQCIYFETDA